MIREQMREILPRYTKGCNDCPVDKCDHCGAFDGIYKELHSLLCAEIEKMGLTQNGNPYYFVEAGSYRPQGLQVYSDREIKLMREAFNVGRTAQLQKILNKLKEGAE